MSAQGNTSLTLNGQETSGHEYVCACDALDLFPNRISICGRF